MKKKLLRTQLVTIRLPREILRSIDVMAMTQEKYRSEIIVTALNEYLKRERDHADAGLRARAIVAQ